MVYGYFMGVSSGDASNAVSYNFYRLSRL